jgi:hypothetical protein
MAALTTQDLVDAGTKPNFALNTPTASDTVEIGNGMNIVAIYKNASGSPVTLTIATPGNTTYGVANPPNVIVIAATTGEAWVPMRKAYDQGTSNPGKALVTLSATTSVTVAVVRHS